MRNRLALLAVLTFAGCQCVKPLADGLPSGDTCSKCHGNADNPAPPQAVVEGKTTADVEVGAHQRHLRGGFARRPIRCDECHVVPETPEAEGHIDLASAQQPSNPADVTFGGLATLGVTPSWNREQATCSNTYCHGTTLQGGVRTTPTWTFAEEPDFLSVLTADSCRGCHGAPPPPPHPARAECELCHPTTVSAAFDIVPGGTHLDGKVDVTITGCSACHGSAANPAPPSDLHGNRETTTRTVGAHQAHLNDSALRKAVGCAECHLVPATLDAPGHTDTPLPAELTFGPLATHDGGVTPGFDGVSCSTYCHGATLHGGNATAPVWTLVDGTQKQCDSCHGAPPPPPHTPSTACASCHPMTVFPDGGIDVDGGHHLDGVLDVGSACTTCHGSEQNAAPPRNLSGETNTSVRGVGAHQAHLTDSEIRKAVGCAECHVVPAAVGDVGHLDTALPAELTFGALATHDGGVVSSFDGTGCTTYCHGATLAGGAASTPEWTRVDGTQKQCGSCHGAPPPSPHPASTACASCHPLTVFPDGGIDVDGGHHLDGVLDVATACNSCHGSANPAPPRDLTGGSSTASRGVGAHQSHLATSTWRNNAIGCQDCHLVPATVGAAGHMDTMLPAELTWSALASGDGGTPSWDPSAQTCTNYCHGARTRGGANKTPQWTRVDGTQAACGTCHGAPPPNHYGFNCELCHPTMGPGFTIIQPARHIDGVVDIAGGGACGGCHAIPPQTGAHAAHYGDSSATPLATYGDERQLSDYFDAGRPYYMFGCGTCHPVSSALHLNGTVEVDLVSTDGGVFKARNGPGASWDATNKTCSNVYCHSSGQAQPVFKTSPAWNVPVFLPCNGCHDNPPAYPSGDAGSPTANVHLVMADDGYEFGHFGGLPGPWHTSFHGGSGAGAITCQACHYATTDPTHTGPSGFYWLNTTGNYRLDGGALNYDCTSCHTVDAGILAPPGAGGVLPLKHVNGTRDVVFDRRMLLPAGYTGGGVTPVPTAPFWVRGSSTTKNFNLADAGYDPVTKTCTNVSCHQAQTSVQWGVTPVGWATCNDCHQY